MVEERDVIIGLTDEEADKRIRIYGLNTLESKKKISPALIFLSQFNDFMTWVLIGATLISGIMGDAADAITILIIVIINGILGFIQEYRTEKSLEALKNLAAPTTKVYRNGKVKVVSAENITIGDILVGEAGDRVAADGTMVAGREIIVDESILTGESEGVEKTISGNSKVFMGTTILKGKALFKVTEVGMSTEMGKIAGMLSEIEEDKSPLKEKLNRLGRILVVVCMIICAIVTFVGIARGQDPGEMFLLGVSLAVAAIPEGLPAIVTVALALGVSRMLKRNALIRKLPAVETLGCTSIICSDKTGTLTENKMTVKAVYMDGQIYDIGSMKMPDNEMMKKAFTYCNDCSYDFLTNTLENGLTGDPTETALIRAYFKDMKEIHYCLNNVKRLYDIPFDSSRKMMSVIVRENSKDICYVKGAPEKLVQRCGYILFKGEVLPFTYDKKRKVLKAIEDMSLKALRCIGAAYKDRNLVKGEGLEKELIFIGIAGIIDPPRKEVKDSIFKCKMAGIRPVMITGDHKNTAFAIGREIDLCSSMDEVLTGEEIEKMSDKELLKRVMKVKIYARVSPNHKLRIVKAYKSAGKVVAMTGDGVNDAPAIKEADIGISMGISGTDVAKEASSMILMDDNFATIVSAVEEGRVIYNNIRKFIRYLLSCNLGEVLTMFLSSVFRLPIPLTPIQILFVNLATDGLPAIALGIDPPDSDIMNEKPRKKNEDIFARGLVEKIVVRGTLIGICTILTFITAKYYGFSLKTARTMTLGTLVLSQLIHVFECRSEKHSLFEIKMFTNPYLVGAVCVSIAMLLGIVYIPFLSGIFNTSSLTIGQWLIVIFFSGIIAFINSMYLYKQH